MREVTIPERVTEAARCIEQARVELDALARAVSVLNRQHPTLEEFVKACRKLARKMR